MTNAQLREQRVDCADLQVGAAAAISQFRGVDVILPIRGQERQGRKPLDDLFARPRAGKTLQQLLQDQAARYDGIATFKRASQRVHLRR